MKWRIGYLALCAAALAIIAAQTEKAQDAPLVEPREEKTEYVLDKSVSETHLNGMENVTLTHYCVCEECCGKSPDHPAYGVTKSGRFAEPYVSVAVDPAIIPLGSAVYVDYGDGDLQEYRADDTGSLIRGAMLDLCVANHQEAVALGVKVVKAWWRE